MISLAGSMAERKVDLAIAGESATVALDSAEASPGASDSKITPSTVDPILRQLNRRLEKRVGAFRPVTTSGAAARGDIFILSS